MAKKRFFLILGVLFGALLMVKATLAAASSARLQTLPEQSFSFTDRYATFGSEFQTPRMQDVRRKFDAAPVAPASDLGESAQLPMSESPPRPDIQRPVNFEAYHASLIPGASSGEPDLPARSGGPDLPTGSSAFDSEFIFAPMVVSESGQLSMWYSGVDRAQNIRVGLASSSDGIDWTKSGSNPLLDGMELFVLEDGGNYEAWLASEDAHIYRAESTDGVAWSLNPPTPVFSPTGQDGDWDRDYVSDPSVVKDGGGIYWMFYEGENRAWNLAQIGVATSTNGIDWQRVSSSPAIAVSGGEWDELYTLDPMVLLEGGKFNMWYSGIHEEGGDWIRSVGFATSTNGIDWNKYGGNPVFEPDPNGWDSGAVATPFVLKDNGYHMWYQSQGAIGYVTSNDGLSWTRGLDHSVLERTPATFVDVDTFNDVVEVWAKPEADITLTVELSGDFYTMTGQVNEKGAFWSWEQVEQGNNWSPDIPDIQPWAAVTVTVDGATEVVNPVGELSLDEFDVEAEMISGTLHASWFTNPSTLTVRCDVWEEGAPSVFVSGVPADGGNFTCDFSGMWDLTVDQNVAVMYYEPDLDLVRTIFRAPWMRVNFGHDWVGGDYEAGHSVSITVTDGGGDPKANAQVQTEPWRGWGTDGFETTWEDWSPEGPDIDAGDLVTITIDDGFERTIKVGEIHADKIDPSADTISGTIQADWFAGYTTTVRCEIWEEGGPPGVRVEGVDLNGGAFTCDFTSVGWDLQPGQHVAVIYLEPDDGDAVINVFVVPWMRVNYAHDWAGGEYPAGHTMSVTVTHDGAFRTGAEVQTKPWGGWDGDGFETDYENDWQPPQPDIQVGDLVTFTSDNGYVNTIRVGEIRLEELDLVNNTISGTIHASWFSPETLSGRCEVWEGPGIEGIEFDGLEADGGGFLCDFNGIYDLQPGMHVAVMYREPNDNDLVINVFQAPAPNLAVEKWVEGSGEVMAGGAVVYTIRIANYGEATAETILVTDTLPDDTSYVTDTSGAAASVGANQVSWTLGPLEAGYDMHFQLVLNNSADVDDVLLNHVEAFVEYDANPDDNSAEAEARVTDGIPDLYVNKNPYPGNPSPGESFYYVIDYGNQGGAASGPVWLTETLPLSTSVVGWFSQNGYNLWQETVNDGEKLALEAPSLPSGWGDQLYLRLLVDAGVEWGTQLTNTIAISTDLDADPGNNWAQNTNAYVNQPYKDTGIYKNMGWGRLMPGGMVGYNLRVENQGNLTSQTWLTDTLPEGFSAEDVKATRWFEGNTTPFPPDVADGRTLAWDLGALKPGESRSIDLEVPIPITIAAGETFTNCAEVETDPPDDYAYNNSDCVVESLHTTGPNLRVFKEYQWTWEGQIEYRIGFLNLGTTTFENLEITDTLPISTEFNGSWWHEFWRGVSLTDDSANGRLIWTLDELQPGWSSNIHFQVDLDGDIIGQGGLAFTNTVSAPVPGDVDTSDNEDTVTAYTGPDIYVEKQLSGGELRPGELITYTIRFGNQNRWPWDTEEGYTCTLTDVLPSQVTFVSATAPWDPNQTWTPDSQVGNTLSWTWDRVWAENWWEFKVVAQIKNNVYAGETLTNHVEMYSSSPNDVEWDWSNNFFDLVESIIKLEIYLPLVLR